MCFPGVASAAVVNTMGGVTLPGHQLARDALTLWMLPHGFSLQYWPKDAVARVHPLAQSVRQGATILS